MKKNSVGSREKQCLGGGKTEVFSKMKRGEKNNRRVTSIWYRGGMEKYIESAKLVGQRKDEKE